MTVQVPVISNTQIAALIGELDGRGYGCLPNYIQPADLARMQAFVRTAV